MKEGTIEEVSGSESTEKEFYLPHEPVIRQSVESTKLRTGCDASPRENDRSPSLIDVIEVGPPLQNHMWKALVRNRMCPVTLTGDMKQTFFKFVSEKKIKKCCGSIGLKTCSQKTSRYTNLQGQYSVLGNHDFY